MKENRLGGLSGRGWPGWYRAVWEEQAAFGGMGLVAIWRLRGEAGWMNGCSRSRTESLRRFLLGCYNDRRLFEENPARLAGFLSTIYLSRMGEANDKLQQIHSKVRRTAHGIHGIRGTATC